MSNDVLHSLLRDYEQNKINAEFDLEERKNKLYKLIPRLSEIDQELTSLGLQVSKNILFDSENSSNYIEKLNEKIENLKNEKIDILLKNNYPSDFLTPNYSCKLCNDTGYILNDNFNTVMCSCLKQKLLDVSFNKSNMYNLKKENFDTFNELLFSDEVDLSKYKFNVSPRKNILNIKQKCIDFVKNFDDPNYKNLLFTGATGLR